MPTTDRFIDLGLAHSFVFTADDFGIVSGIIVKHVPPAPHESGLPLTCHVAITFSPHHKASSLHPLSVEGQIVCDACKDRGFIREGRWIVA